MPPEYQDLYTSLSNNILSFNDTLNQIGKDPGYPVLNVGQLGTATSDITTSLLNPDYYTNVVLPELNSLQALGVTAVNFHVNFPSLYRPFYNNPTDYQNYLNFYTQLVQEIRNRGLKLVIENTVAKPYPGSNGGSFAEYYESLSWPAYQYQRAQLAADLAEKLKPDYLVVVAEPDTEVLATGQTAAGTVSGSTQMVKGMIAAIQETGVSGVAVGAGCGTWDIFFTQFMQSFAGLSGLDFVDMHVYPVNRDYLPNALTAASIIHAAGKEATISEMWPYKVADDELGVLSYTTVFSRDAFSFWEPIDQTFLWLMRKFAASQQFTFTSPFWTGNFGAYLDYGEYGSLPEETIITDEQSAGSQAFSVGSFSPTGVTFESTVTPSPDLRAPSKPAAPTIGTYSQTVVNLSWSASTDNTGVAAYNIYRDGVLVGKENSPLSFSDQNLQPATTYSYSISAFDAAGNESSQSDTASVTTYPVPDHEPPSTPAFLLVRPTSDVSVTLNWTPGSDNVGVIGYAIYRGSSADSLLLWGTSITTSFVDSNVFPSSTYYYAVDAYDAFYNHSAKSTVVSATTPDDVTPPTTPARVRGRTDDDEVTISWQASTDDFAVVNYKIYRGSSPDNLQLFAATTFLNYVDAQAVSGKTYYYAVSALDLAKNESPLSATVEVTAP